jgi:Flp pilus assembly pilin Flp
MLNQIRHFATSLMARVMVTREDGQALVEYSLILALVSIAAILVLTSLGTAIGTELQKVVTAL